MILKIPLLSEDEKQREDQLHSSIYRLDRVAPLREYEIHCNSSRASPLAISRPAINAEDRGRGGSQKRASHYVAFEAHRG
jgi:hypothetical protein